MKPFELPDEKVFEGALDCGSPAERAAYLDRVCAGKPELRRTLEKLLAAHEKAGAFMEAPSAVHALPLELEPGETTGAKIGRYKLLQRMGEGGMGTVYMAEQTEPVVRKVALKIIKLGMDTKAVVARFEAERQALALMDHPNIAKVLDAGATDAGRPYFVMELVHGVPITEYCDRHKLPTKERLELFIPVCQAIQHAHQKGIIHRDIKPSNVMVTLHDGVPVPRVIDFGIAKATNQRLTEKTLFTHYAQMIGTPAYMSPEQAEMSPAAAGDIDTRTDVYSLGVLLYELLTGTTPFDAKELLSKGYGEMQRVIAEQEPPKPSTRMTTLKEEQRTVVAKNRGMDAGALRRGLQGDPDWIVMKCLEKDRTRRYETVNGLAADLRRHLANEPVVARPPTAAYRFQKWARRHRLTAALALAGAAVLATTLVVLIVANLRIAAARNAEQQERTRAVEVSRKLEQSNDRLTETVRQLELQQVEEMLASGRSATAMAHLADITRRDPFNQIAASRLVSTLMHRNLAILAVPPIRYDGSISGVDIKRDGVSLLAASTDGVARLWYLPTGQPVGPSMTHTSSVTVAKFSPDGTFLTLGYQDGSVRLWDAATLEMLPGTIKHQGPVTDLNFDASESFLISATENKGAKIWSVPDARLIRSLGPFGSRATIAMFVPGDASKVLVCSARGSVMIWSVSGGEALMNKRGHQDYVTSARFTRDGRRFVTASRDGTARLWDTATGLEVIEPLRHSDWVHSAEFDPKEKLIVTACQDGTVRIWSAKDGRPMGETLKHDGAVRSAVFSDGGSRIATASLDVTARLWDARTGAMLCQPLWHREMVTKALFGWGGSRLVTASSDSQVRIWDISGRQYQPLTTLTTNHLNTLALAPDGKSFAAATKDGWVWRCDVTTGRALGEPIFLDAHATGVGYSPDGRWLAVAGGRQHEAQVWEIASGQPRFSQRPRHGNVIRNVCFSSQGDRLLTYSMDGTARVWDAQTGAPVAPAMKHDRDVIWAEFSPDGSLVVTASLDQTARIWDAHTGEPITGSLPHLDVLTQATFSPDGRRVVTASSDNHARIWDARTGELQVDLSHARIVNHARFSPDGRLVATAAIDRTARIWDAQSGQAVTPPMRHDHFVSDAVFSPDGARLLTTTVIGHVRLWDVKTGRPLTEPLSWGRPREAFLPHFTPDGRRVVVGKAGAGAAIWDLPPTPVPVPAWFAGFAENLAGLRVGPQGHPELTSSTPLSQFMDRPELIPDGNYYSDVARWLVDSLTTRPRSPFSEGAPAASDSMSTLAVARAAPPSQEAAQTPGARDLHTAVWTGEEMIVWGGFNHRPLSDGWRYHPGANRWQQAGPEAGNVLARYGHTAVWTGHEMIVWGGVSRGNKHLNDGARFDPKANAWTPMLPVGRAGTPSVRCWHTAVWTGGEMIVWGGESTDGIRLNDGARFDPISNTWAPIPSSLPNTPSARSHHTAAWTGHEMIVWGGFDGRGPLNDGARYDPRANTWTPIPGGLPNSPSARWNLASVWSGRELIVWGGCRSASQPLGGGGRYDPGKNEWTALRTIPGPTVRMSQTPMAVWTGAELVLWGGQDARGPLNDGWRYDPSTDQWTALPVGPLSRRCAHTVLWSGNEVIVWGGDAGGGNHLNDGARFDPKANAWTPIPPATEERSESRSPDSLHSGR